MKIEYDTEKLINLMHDIYCCTKISASVFDTNYKCIAYNSLEYEPCDSLSRNTYCSCIKKDPERAKLCFLSDSEHMQISSVTKKIVIYTCHAGLVEMVMPICHYDVVIGYIVCGKFRDRENKYSSVEKVKEIAEKYNLDEKDMISRYKKLSVLSNSEITSFFNIAKICIKYILHNQLISLKNNFLTQKIKTYITENLASPLSVSMLAKKFYVSKNHLYSLFVNEFGISVSRFITNERIKKAKELLIETEKPIVEISELCGYTEYNYFIRIFKKETGISPLKYRKQNGLSDK